MESSELKVTPLPISDFVEKFKMNISDITSINDCYRQYLNVNKASHYYSPFLSLEEWFINETL